MKLISLFFFSFLSLSCQKDDDIQLASEKLRLVALSSRPHENHYLNRISERVVKNNSREPKLKGLEVPDFLNEPSRGISSISLVENKKQLSDYFLFVKEGSLEKDGKYSWVKSYSVSKHFLNLCLFLSLEGDVDEKDGYIEMGFTYLSSLRSLGDVSLMRAVEYTILERKYRKAISLVSDDFILPERKLFSSEEIKKMILLDWLLINEGELKGITEFSSAHEKKIMTNSIAIGIEEMLDDEELVFEVGFTKKYQGFQRGDDNLRLERYRLDLEGLVLSLLEKK